MSTTYSKRDAMMGGPGLNGYAYRADVYCVPCGRGIIEAGPDEISGADFLDSEVTPQPIFFGESDTAQHCGSCGAYLYGGEVVGGGA